MLDDSEFISLFPSTLISFLPSIYYTLFPSFLLFLFINSSRQNIHPYKIIFPEFNLPFSSNIFIIFNKKWLKSDSGNSNPKLRNFETVSSFLINCF